MRGSIVSWLSGRMPVERREVPSARSPSSRWPLPRCVRCGWLPWYTPGTWDGPPGLTSGLPTVMLYTILFFLIVTSEAAEHRRVALLDDLAVAGVHVDAA